jgi:hypothetical protein
MALWPRTSSRACTAKWKVFCRPRPDATGGGRDAELTSTLQLSSFDPMSVDPRTLGWLSRALTHEMSAVQQYLAQSVLARLWGDESIGDKHLRQRGGSKS